MQWTLHYSKRAQRDLAELYDYIAGKASIGIARRYTAGITAYCRSLCTFPHRGVSRDDVRPGLRVTNYRGRVALPFVIDGERILILGVYSGGKSYAGLSNDEEDDWSDDKSLEPES